MIKTRFSVGLVLLALLAAPAAALAQNEKIESRIGVGVDSRGGPVIDPTKNVLDLVEAAIRRQDDLRAAIDRLIDSRIKALGDSVDMRAKHSMELAAAESRRVNEQLQLRADYDDKLRLAEAKRIDAIRAVDVNAVAVANQRTSEQATALQTQTTQSAEVLRNQVARSAEDLRALVATTAATALQNQQQQFAGLSTRITTLEQALSEGKGKQAFADPAFTQLLQEVKSLRETSTSGAGKSEGISSAVAVLLTILGLLLAALAVGIPIIFRTRAAPARR